MQMPSRSPPPLTHPRTPPTQPQTEWLPPQTMFSRHRRLSHNRTLLNVVRADMVSATVALNGQQRACRRSSGAHSCTRASPCGGGRSQCATKQTGQGGQGQGDGTRGTRGRRQGPTKPARLTGSSLPLNPGRPHPLRPRLLAPRLHHKQHKQQAWRTAHILQAHCKCAMDVSAKIFGLPPFCRAGRCCAVVRPLTPNAKCA